MATVPNNGKKFTFRISWFYIILIGLLVWMFFGDNDAKPQKIEWAEVKEIWQSGDIKEVTFVRNEFEGEVTLKPDKVEKYVDMFKEGMPKKSPHFNFMVSSSFNAENEFGALNDSLAVKMPEEAVKVVVENRESWWSVFDWLLFPLLLILMWFFMFRGVNKGGGGPGGVFNVGKANGKLLVKTDADEALCGEIAVSLDTEAWTSLAGNVRIGRGIHALYFCYEGEGALDFKGFELFFPE
jgi:cell division protease FtsH